MSSWGCWSGQGSSNCSCGHPENSAGSSRNQLSHLLNLLLPRRLGRLIINMGMGGKPWENHYLANIHKYPLDLCDPLEWVCLIKCIFPQNTWHAPNKPMLRISWELRTSCFLNHLTKKHRHLTIPFKLFPAENFPPTDKCSLVFCSWSSSRHPPPQVTWYWCL